MGVEEDDDVSPLGCMISTPKNATKIHGPSIGKGNSRSDWVWCDERRRTASS